MLVSQYHRFVRSTDQYAEKSDSQRLEIAVYGLVGEIGSVVSSVKKQLLAEDGVEKWNHASHETLEELGDVFWYCFSLIQIANRDQAVNIFTKNIAVLRAEIGANNDRAREIRKTLGAKSATFLKQAKDFPKTKKMNFGDYQKLAFLTARTHKKTLLEVCLSVLWQLGAELMRLKLPPIEQALNKSISDRHPNIIIGEIVWHLAAIASVYEKSLDEIVEANVEKVIFRRPQAEPTALHDLTADLSQQLPRRFEISFITVGVGRSRMYFNGKQLGDDLTDNAYDDDGYRFHDVMHLANAAFLGWSPVLRGLLGRKRKKNPKIDEVEDGARAKIVEEAVIKIIHSEGVTLAGASTKEMLKPVRLFPSRASVAFSLVKLVHRLVFGLEVRRNKYWEWEKAIVEGYEVFHDLCREEQGTVTVDLVSRTLAFRPEVYIDVNGTVSGIGVASEGLLRLPSAARDVGNRLELLTDSERSDCHSTKSETERRNVARIVAAKRAILGAVGLQNPQSDEFQELSIHIDGNRVATKASGQTRAETWKKKIISFKIALTETQNSVNCTALAISDPAIQ